MSLDTVLEKLPGAYIAGATGGRDCVLQFTLSDPVQVAIVGDHCSVRREISASPDVELTMSDEVFVELMRGNINGIMGVMSGKIGVEGDIGLARQALEFFDSSKLD
jgi:putative sterol carrier protein